LKRDPKPQASAWAALQLAEVITVKVIGADKRGCLELAKKAVEA